MKPKQESKHLTNLHVWEEKKNKLWNENGELYFLMITSQFKLNENDHHESFAIFVTQHNTRLINSLLLIFN